MATHLPFGITQCYCYPAEMTFPPLRTCVCCYYRIHQLRHLCQLLDFNSLATLVYTIVNSRIDYCNTVLTGAPRTVTDKLQHVLNVLHAASPALGRFTAVWVRYCTTNFTDLTSSDGFLQDGSDSSLVPEWLRTTIRVSLLCPDRRC